MSLLRLTRHQRNLSFGLITGSAQLSQNGVCDGRLNQRTKSNAAALNDRLMAAVLLVILFVTNKDMKMLRISLASSVALLSSSAIAHPGHIEPLAGLSHYVVLGALVVAAAIGLFAFRKFKSTNNV